MTDPKTSMVTVAVIVDTQKEGGKLAGTDKLTLCRNEAKIGANRPARVYKNTCQISNDSVLSVRRRGFLEPGTNDPEQILSRRTSQLAIRLAALVTKADGN